MIRGRQLHSILPCGIAAACLLAGGATLRAQISGDYTLGASQTFASSITADPFTIGDSHSTLNLQNFNATLTGTGDFSINSSITGSGGVTIDLTDPTRQVDYNNGNSYSGLTTVRSGILFLSTPSEANNGIPGNLYIGGGLNQAIVRRDDKHNRELIADNSTVTIAANGTLEFDRMGQGNSHVHDSLETLGRLVMNGGTLLNASDNDRLTTLNIGTVTLLSSSVWDLGEAMTMSIGNVNTNAWTPGAILTIRNWSSNEPIYVGRISQSQIGQIRFETPYGLMGAQQLPDTQIVPVIIVPEASTFIFIPMLIGAALWPELRRRVRKQ